MKIGKHKIDEKTICNFINDLFWILSSTWKLIIYHYDKNDLYKIDKFVNGLENNTVGNIELLNSSINELCSILIKNNGVRGNYT